MRFIHCHMSDKYKVILIGDTGVGKSSILFRKLNGQFPTSPTQTIGIDFQEESIPIDGKIYSIYFWDTAGQERFKSITTAYYKDACAVLVVFDLNNKTSFENCVNWLELAKKFTAPDKPPLYFLIGNKSDQEQLVSLEEIYSLTKKYNIHHFSKVSAKQGDNINELFTTIIRLMIKKCSPMEQSGVKLQPARKHPNNSCC
jgi:Ras-related protein Rab-8A